MRQDNETRSTISDQPGQINKTRPTRRGESDQSYQFSMGLLSTEESLKFIKDILMIEHLPNLPVTSIGSTERVELLTKLIFSYLEHEPFQSITLMSQDVDKRHRRPWEDIKQDIFTRQGGLCYSLNTFMFALLSSLGYDVRMAHATCCGGITYPNNHLVLLVTGLVEAGDKHLVDVGLGYAIPRPISLEFPGASQEYTDSFQSYKFVKESNDEVVLKLKKPLAANASSTSEDAVPVNPICEWRSYYTFSLSESYVNIEEFYCCYDTVFSDITKLSLQTSPRAMHWPRGRFLGLVETRLVAEDGSARLVKTDLRRCQAGGTGSEKFAQPGPGNSRSDVCRRQEDPLGDLQLVLQHYAKLFPQLSQELVRAALRNWRLTGSLAKVPEHLA